ncbi:hypothetical protein TNCT_370311 [Trichonephila clavata]|uniref:Uncharacterized protein n=1 Tax=Trichonephila clavata TaxID=2740835 RepID=A0A8X6KTU3_TRICU|nr:hypothetical protein TNCT_370311 [Trichonephila clavata]
MRKRRHLRGPTITSESSSLQSSWRASPNAGALRVELVRASSAMPYPETACVTRAAADDASLQSHSCSSTRSLSRDFLSGCSAACSALKPFLDPLAGRRTLSERGP